MGQRFKTICSRYGQHRLIAFGLALCLVAILFWVVKGERSKMPASERSAPPVHVMAAKAVKRDFPVFFQSLGTVTALNTVTVKSRVDGELTRIHFTEGQQVTAGELLAEIDPRPFEAELAQAEGQLLRDRALLRNALQDLKRYKTLLPQDSATPQQVDAAEALARQYEASVKIDTAQIAAVKLQLAYCRITAPISGRLGLKLVDQGNIVRASDSAGIVVITEINPISVLFTVTESQLPQVLSGMHSEEPLVVEAWDRTRTVLLAEGTLVTTDNRIDTATGTVKLKAVFANNGGKLFPNQFVNARIRVKTVRDAVLVPTAAVQHASRGPFVFVADNNSAVLRDVTVAESDDSFTVVTDGVREGDTVIVDGVDRLRDGSAVKAVLPEPHTPSGSQHNQPYGKRETP